MTMSDCNPNVGIELSAWEINDYYITTVTPDRGEICCIHEFKASMDSIQQCLDEMGHDTNLDEVDADEDTKVFIKGEKEILIAFDIPTDCLAIVAISNDKARAVELAKQAISQYYALMNDIDINISVWDDMVEEYESEVRSS